jgi:AmiR/NasT family two-component response regulator
MRIETERACGMVMAWNDCDADEALVLLQQRASAVGLDLGEYASQIVRGWEADHRQG